jgi:hypothetical protein
MSMVQRRNLSIGITVNLENYENLRLEVSGEVGEDQGAEDLIAYLDDILSNLGRGTPETAERVDSFRRRVLSLPGETTARIAPVVIPLAEGTSPAPIPLKVKTEAPPAVVSSKTPPPPLPQGKTPPLREAAPSGAPSAPVIRPVDKKGPVSSIPPLAQPEKTTIPSPSPKKEISSSPPLAPKKESPPSPAVAKTTPAEPAPSSDSALSCERCGVAITPVQRKLSRLFQNKDLCKKCLNQP